MAKKRFTAVQIAAILREAKKAPTDEEILRKNGISEQTFYCWKKMYGNLGTVEVQRFKQLESENRKLKQLVGDQALAIQILQEQSNKRVLIEDQQEMAKAFLGFGFPERQACLSLQINRAAYRYSPSDKDPLNETIRKEFLSLQNDF